MCFISGGFFNVIWLVVSIHLKNISQIRSFPQVGTKIENISKHHLVMVWSILPLFSACLFPELTIFTMVNTLQTHYKHIIKKTPAKTTHIKATIISLLNQTTTDKKKNNGDCDDEVGVFRFFLEHSKLSTIVCVRKEKPHLLLLAWVFTWHWIFKRGPGRKTSISKLHLRKRCWGSIFWDSHMKKKKQGRILLCTFRWSLFWVGMDFWWPQ